MKNLLLPLALFLTSSSFASACPHLKGRYYCEFSNGEGSKLTIDQWADPVTDRVVNYTFSYIEDSPYVEPIKFSDIGHMGPMGWMNICRGEALISYLPDRSRISKIYFKEGRLVRESNGKWHEVRSS